MCRRFDSYESQATPFAVASGVLTAEALAWIMKRTSESPVQTERTWIHQINGHDLL